MPAMTTRLPCATISAEHLRWLALVISLFSACISWAAEAGRFLYVQGEVRIKAADGIERRAQKGETLHEHETVSLGLDSWAQLRMKDAAMIALRPDTVFKVDAYRYNGTEDGSESSVLRLVKGGFRSLTGTIGKTNRDRYRVVTETSTIGIRGTDHEPVYIPPSGGWSGAPGADPGTYDKVNSGATFIETQGGRIELGPNQAGYVPPRIDATPTRLERMPDFYRPQAMMGTGRPGGHQQGGKPQDGKPQDGKPQDGKPFDGKPQFEGKPDEGKPQEGKPPLTGNQQFEGKPQDIKGQFEAKPQGSIITPQSGSNIIQPGSLLPLQNSPLPGNNTITPGTNTGPNLLPTNPLPAGNIGPINTIQPIPNTNVTVTESITPAPAGYALAGGDKSGSLMGAGAGTVGNGDNMNVMLGVNGNPVLVGNPDNNLTYTRSGAGAAQIGKQDFEDGTTVRWGIYSGGKIVDATGTQRNADFFHFASASQSLPQSALPGFSGQYTSIKAFTSPITEAGWKSGTGNVTTNIVINNGTLTSLNLGVLDWQGRQWSASNLTTPSFSEFVSSGIKVGGSVSGSTATGVLDPLSSKLSGIPVGQAGNGLIGSYILRTTDNKAVTGSFLAR